MGKTLTLGEKAKLKLEQDKKSMYDKYINTTGMTAKCMLAKAISEMEGYMSYGQLMTIYNTDLDRYYTLERRAEEYMKSH